MDNYNSALADAAAADKELYEAFTKHLSAYDRLRQAGLDEVKPFSLPENRNSYGRASLSFANMIKSIDNKRHYETGYAVKNQRMLPDCSLSSIATVCYQGLPYSYSECTSRLMFPDSTLVNRKSFEDVFKAVFDGDADVGVVPVENSTAGGINDVYDLLLKYDLYITGNYIKRISHCLAGTPDSELSSIKHVHSHPQAIMQCKKYLETSGYRTVNEINTAVAAQKIAQNGDKEAAAICSEDAAKMYGLKILKTQINDFSINATRFASISATLCTSLHHTMTSIVFSIPHETGSLNETLSVFSYYGINLTSIYSRPDTSNSWKYMFYVDFEGNLLHSDVQSILNQFQAEMPFIKVLGSYSTQCDTL